ncbi:hypothetical protein HDC94_000208 [Leifsonia sp. AK011]|uniref:hypothetical protein n=1 Tax=Leifsonia sp. AK011 TaxID=2723075 RepID=UPI0015CC1A88|nr:hypothetical protein [Leifsonia sp. AK011]NYF09052.1 hypothetical protein [Leifsonia sp. AK011]
MKRAAIMLVALLALAGCTPAQDATSPRPVEPIVTAAAVDGDGFLHASAYVEGVVESGGTCRFTFWADWGGASRLTSTASVVDGRTECGDVEEHIQPLRAGDYELVVTYESGGAEVESEPFGVSIPEH